MGLDACIFFKAIGTLLLDYSLNNFHE